MLFENIFRNILNMSITASYVAIVVIFIRFIIKKAPKNFSFVLWIAVLFRLVCPISFMSKLSIFNFINQNSFRKMDGFSNNITINSDIYDTGIKQITNKNISGYIGNNLSTNNLNIFHGLENNLLEITTILWIIGIQILIVYFIASYIDTYLRIRTATLYRENIFESDQIDTAFIFGLFKPRVYIPVNTTKKEKIYIIEHEKVHLKRKDYLIKIIAFFLLTIHWFNPIMWFSFILMSKDMEMSCDEKVMKNLGEDKKKDYSHSLLNLAVNKGNIFDVPLSFSESNITSRIKNILNYKTPKKSVLLTLTVVMITSTVFLISNPKNNILDEKVTLRMKEIENDIPYIDIGVGKIDNKIIDERYKSVNKKELTYNAINTYTENLSKEEIQRLNKYKPTYKSILLGFTYFSESNPISLDYDEALKLTKTVLPDDIEKIGSEIDNEVNKEYIYYKSSKGDFRVGLRYGYVYDDNVEKVDKNLIVGIDYAKK